jgi:hypothetical protein
MNLLSLQSQYSIKAAANKPMCAYWSQLDIIVSFGDNEPKAGPGEDCVE